MPNLLFSPARRRLLGAVAGAPILIALASANADGTRPSNKWRIEFSEAANSDGIITFLLTPEVGYGQVVKTEIPDGTSENHVARLVRDSFREQLDPDHYHVEVDDGEDVLLKRKQGQPDFALELISNSVKSVRIHLQRE